MGGLSSRQRGCSTDRSTSETVEYAAQGAATTPSFVARLVDDDGRPVKNLELAFMVRRIEMGGSDSGENFVATADTEGRVRFTLGEEAPVGGRRTVQIMDSWNAKDSKIGWAATTVDLTPRFAPGLHDLGDVALHVPGSRKHLRVCTDEELERIYRGADGGFAFSRDPEHDADTCLTEMIARGGERWTRFIQHELEEHASKLQAEDRSEDELVTAQHDVRLLTVLRRLQRRPDPCQLEIVDAPVVETVFPASPLVHYKLKNADEAPLAFNSWELENPGRNSTWRLEARTRDGTSAQLTDYMCMNQGFVESTVLAPGESHEAGADVRDHLCFPSAGDYVARLYQRHGQHDFYKSVGSIDGWICSRSEEFTIRVLPHPIEPRTRSTDACARASMRSTSRSP